MRALHFHLVPLLQQCSDRVSSHPRCYVTILFLLYFVVFFFVFLKLRYSRIHCSAAVVRRKTLGKWCIWFITLSLVTDECVAVLGIALPQQVFSLPSFHPSAVDITATLKVRKKEKRLEHRLRMLAVYKAIAF